MSAWTVKQGDYHRQIALDLTDITTAGAIGVVFRLRPRQGGAVVSRAGTIVSATRVSCQFQAPELDTAGSYDLEATLTYVDGGETVPTSGYVLVEVLPKLSA